MEAPVPKTKKEVAQDSCCITMGRREPRASEQCHCHSSEALRVGHRHQVMSIQGGRPFGSAGAAVHMWAGAVAWVPGVRVGRTLACYVLSLRWLGVHSEDACQQPSLPLLSPCLPRAAQLGIGIRLRPCIRELSLDYE